MADKDLDKVVRQALLEGANPRGFSAELKAVYEKQLQAKAKKVAK